MSLTAHLPKIAIMIGDPAGVGPEVCVKAVASSELDKLCTPILIGSKEVLQRATDVVNVPLHMQVVSNPAEHINTQADQQVVRLLDPGGFDVSACPFGQASEAAGHAVLDWLALGSRLGADGEIQGLVMAPVDSGSIKLTGRIEHIDDLQPAGTYMLRMSGPLRIVPLTEHVPLSAAITQVNPQTVFELVEMLHQQLEGWGLAKPRIAVAGINPHAMFEQDKTQIAPAIERAQQQGIDAHGPISPDSVFRMASEGKYDAVVSMYHDQGQIALKTSSFAGACTVYMGLSYPMLNVPHGSAFDIAGKGIAQHESVLTAIKAAAGLAIGKGIFL